MCFDGVMHEAEEGGEFVEARHEVGAVDEGACVHPRLPLIRKARGMKANIYIPLNQPQHPRRNRQ